MKDISKIDKNLVVETHIVREGLEFFDVEEEPFRIYGVKMENGKFRRMPEKIAVTVSERVGWLHTNTAAVNIQFRK